MWGNKTKKVNKQKNTDFDRKVKVIKKEVTFITILFLTGVLIDILLRNNYMVFTFVLPSLFYIFKVVNFFKLKKLEENNKIKK
jgi:L-asparagine transporter-like permease